MRNRRGKKWIWLAPLALALALSACQTREEAPEETRRPRDTDPEETEESWGGLPWSGGETPEPEVTPDVPETEAPTEEPEHAPIFSIPSPEPTEEPAPVQTGPLLTAQEPRTDDLFADAAFFGNSLVDGLDLFGDITQGDFYGVTSASVVSVGTVRNCALADGTPVTQLEALFAHQYGKIYILLGINEISFPTDYFIQLYSEMLDTIAEREPEAEIYIMSLTPLTWAKSADATDFTMTRVLAYNQALLALAEERGCWYVDLVDALSGPDGYLPADGATDGVHLTVDKYHLWADYLRSHYPPEG